MLFIANKTWDLVSSNLPKNLIDSKWIYKTKYNHDGSIERKKTILAAKENNPHEGIDYDETFSPVARPATIRLVLYLAISNGCVSHQSDVKNDFLQWSFN